MRVLKRNGDYEDVSFDKVLNRIRKLSEEDIGIDICEIAQKVCSRIFDGVKTSELDELAAQMCSSMMVQHPDYGKLASRIIVSNHHKNTSPSFSETVSILFNNKIVSQELYDIVQMHKEKLNSYIDYTRDYSFDYFGFKTLERSYLLRANGKIVERPQHMWMRVALGIHGHDLKDALQTYDMMSQKYFTHATPTLFNAGTPRPQNSSCFLMSMQEDSIVGIFDTLKEIALISKHAGGIGVHIHQIRSRGSKIRGNNGIASGIVPMLRVFNNTARYVDQAGKRLGSIAVYIEPHHADIEAFLELKKNHGNEEERCRDLFLALWVPDLFMKRVRENAEWSLMCPDTCRGLSDVWGEEFERLYEDYEKKGMYVKKVKAQDLWFRILECQIETGVPYICYKDAANTKSNQQNIGTIKSSNLCVAPETMILTEDGYFPIHELKDKEVKVWNGHEMSKTVVRQTGVQQKLIKIGFSNGMKIRCTPYHKFHIDISLNDNKSKVRVVDAKDLMIGANIIHYQTPLITSGKKVMENPYTHGVFCANEFTNNPIITQESYSLNLLNGQTAFIPHDYTIDIKIRWLEGFMDQCGSATFINGVKNIQVSSIDNENLTSLFYMLQTLGLNARINSDNLIIDREGIFYLQSIGFSPKSLDINDLGTTKVSPTHVKVVSVKDNDDYDDTYCFNEPLRHMGIFNGVITGQCTEIMEVSTPDEIAVCNLSSICLPTYVQKDGPDFNFNKLHAIAKIVTKNLNKVIDRNYYPLEKARKSNLRHRPIGIGVQGLMDVFMMLRIPFESEEAKILNKQIFETIYHGAVEASMEIAKKRHEIILSGDQDAIQALGLNEYEKDLVKYQGAYSTFDGSPVSKGILQFDMWGVAPSGMYDWNKLKQDIKKYGVRNSLLLAPMPTASTAQIMGFNESFEPMTSNLFKRKTLSGEFIVMNKYLVEDLMTLGLWSKEMKDTIILHEGSIQNIADIPDDLKQLYKTVWEIKQKTVIDMSADRGPFICQSQSLNIFMEEPDFKKLSSMHFYGWQKGLKTGSYYLRTKPRAKTQQFTIDPEFAKQNKKPNVVCTDEVCTSCSA